MGQVVLADLVVLHFLAPGGVEILVLCVGIYAWRRTRRSKAT